MKMYRPPSRAEWVRWLERESGSTARLRQLRSCGWLIRWRRKNNFLAKIRASKPGVRITHAQPPHRYYINFTCQGYFSKVLFIWFNHSPFFR